MAQENLFDLNIPSADLQAVQDAIQTLATKLAPHLSSLSAEDRRALPKMGDKSLAFVRKAREYAHNYRATLLAINWTVSGCRVNLSLN